MEEITPEESAAPVYLVPPTEEELLELEQFAQEEQAREAELLAAKNTREEARNNALVKLAQLGLTEEEAKAVIGIG
jgi:hypothetical protein